MDDTSLLEEAISAAREFENFDRVLLAVSIHPEWLTFIPENRKWSILHQIVFSGNLDILDQLLALQKANKNFDSSVCTRDGKTIADVAAERKDMPAIKERINKLMKLDHMLSYARNCKWDDCYELVKKNPSFVNEKPPYRRFYLIHHMACAGALDQFDRFGKIPGCVFDASLRADGKTAPTVARENNRTEFAKYLEHKYQELYADDEDANGFDPVRSYPASEQAKINTKQINLAMEQPNVMRDLEKRLHDQPTGLLPRGAVEAKLHKMNAEEQAKSRTAAAPVAQKQEKTSEKALLEVLTCPLTHAICVDPGMCVLYKFTVVDFYA